MMKKFLVLLGIIALFVACDYAKESTELYPDIEITYMNPIGWYTSDGDTVVAATIEQINFVPENSVDCYLTKVIWEYYDEGNNIFYGPEEMSLYLKIEGKVDEGSCSDTFYIYNLQLPLAPVWYHLDAGQSAEARLHFVFVDEYWGSRTDTVTAWFGFYMWPDSTGAIVPEQTH